MRPVRVLARAWRAIPLRGGLGRRILMWFLVLSLVPLLVSNTVGYNVTHKIIEGQVRDYLRALTAVQANHVAAEVERQQLYLDAVVAGNAFLAQSVPAAAEAVRAGRRRAPVVAALHEHLDRKLSELGSLTELFVIDTGGTVVVATRHDRLGTDWSETPVFRQGRAGRYLAEGRETSQWRDEPLLRLATPIHDEQGRWVGVLAGSVHFREMRELLRLPTHVAGDVRAYIVDGVGRPLLVSSAPTAVDYGEPLPSPLVERPAGSVARYTSLDGAEVFGASVAVPGMSWRYISEVSVAGAFGQLRGLALLAAALESVFALLLVGIVWIVARSIVTPLRRLVGAAERIRKGDLGVEVQIERDDELGDLGRTFNQMSSELQASAEQIQELHDQQMRRAAQLASVGELASGIAHEIKNPIVGVASGIDLLSKRLKQDQKAEAILSQIRAQVHRIESAVQDLLSYGRPKEPRLVEADPRELVDRLVGLIRPQAEAAGVRVEQRRDGEIPKVRVDPELLTQALVNLALNGIQAMEAGGVLEISAERVDDQVHISISDTGSGIAQSEIEKIFRPFYTTKHQGTGLGLAITRGIVERHGGRLQVKSEVGRGSVFTLVISAASQAVAAR